MPVGSIRYPASAGGDGGVGSEESGDESGSAEVDEPNYPPTTGDRDLVYLDGKNTTDGGGRTLQILMNLPPGR